MSATESEEVWYSGHTSVFVENFTDHTGTAHTRETRKIYGGFGVSTPL